MIGRLILLFENYLDTSSLSNILMHRECAMKTMYEKTLSCFIENTTRWLEGNMEALMLLQVSSFPNTFSALNA